MSARILIVEDNRVNLELVEYLLKAFGYATFAAMDGQEGVRAAKEMHPDLIICDLQMPIMNGFEVMRELNKDPLFRQVPVIAVTALSMPGDREKILSAGFKGYLSKPIDPETFVQTITKFLPPELRAQKVQRIN